MKPRQLSIACCATALLVSTGGIGLADLVNPPSLSQGNYLLVAGTFADKVLRFDGATGQYIDDFITARSGGLDEPSGMALGADGHLYVASANNDRILRYDGQTGQFIDVFGTNAEAPLGMLFGPDDNLYVASRDHNGVIRYDGATGEFIDLFATTDRSALWWAEDLAFGPDEDLYLSSFARRRVLRFNGATGAFIDTFASGGGLSQGGGITFGPDGHLYVPGWFSDGVHRFNGTTGEFIDVFAIQDELVPTNVAFGPDGNLYVTSRHSGIYRFDGTTGEYIDQFSQGGDWERSYFLLFTAPVPEPSTFVLAAVGLLGLALLKRKDRLRTRCRVVFPAALLTVTGLLPTDPAAAAQTTWQLLPPTVGDWSKSDNWSDGVPGSSTLAVIDNGGIAAISQNALADDLVMGTAVGQSGHVVQTSGHMSVAQDLTVGSFGNGSYDFAGGTLRARTVSVGSRTGSTGSMTISGEYLRPGYFFLGRGEGTKAHAGTATVLQTEGTVEVYYAGLAIQGPHTTYELQGGTLLALDQTIKGHDNTRFVQSGGTNDAHSPSGGGYGSGLLRVGIDSDSEALYELHAGDLLTNETHIGAYLGIGRLTQTGGQHHVFGDAGVGRRNESEGTYELSGGSLTVDGSLVIGTGGKGELSVLGSEATLQSGDLYVGDAGTMSCTLSTSGVSTAHVSGDAAFSGTLKVLDDSAKPGEFLLLEVEGNLSFNPLTVELPGPQWSWHLTDNTVGITYFPEPSTLILLCIGVVGLLSLRTRRRSRSHLSKEVESCFVLRHCRLLQQ